MDSPTESLQTDTPLRRLRKARKLRLEDVAKGIHWDTGNLSRVERGMGTSPEMAERLVKFYGAGITEMEILYPERYMPAGNEGLEARI